MTENPRLVSLFVLQALAEEPIFLWFPAVWKRGEPRLWGVSCIGEFAHVYKCFAAAREVEPAKF